jgi:hypothetical protein
MARFQKKPVVIDAVRFDGNYRCLDIFPLSEVGEIRVSKNTVGDPCLLIDTLEGVMTAQIGDWIIRGVKGEYYSCKPDIFELTYAPSSEETERLFIVTDDCMWEKQKQEGTKHPHAIVVVDAETGQTRLIESGSRIRFVEGEITQAKTQERYNEQGTV